MFLDVRHPTNVPRLPLLPLMTVASSILGYRENISMYEISSNLRRWIHHIFKLIDNIFIFLNSCITNTKSKPLSKLPCWTTLSLSSSYLIGTPKSKKIEEAPNIPSNHTIQTPSSPEINLRMDHLQTQTNQMPS